MKLEIFLCLCFVITLGAYQSSASFSESSNQSCPIWTTPKVINGTIGCECGNTLNSVVVCETNNFAVHILLYYCMSYSDELNTTVVGSVCTTYTVNKPFIINTIGLYQD